MRRHRSESPSTSWPRVRLGSRFREFGIESFYCRPGIEGAHEEGGVEGQIGYSRRNHFVPVPEVASLAELNEMVEQWDRQDEARRIGARPKTVAEYFAVEQPLLMPLPEEPFETDRLFTPRVDSYGQISVRTNRYSVPIRLIGKRVRVVLYACHLVVYDQNVEVARHERLIAKGAVRLDLDHYLEVLVRKPGAFPGSTALDQARSAGRFTPVHDAWWAQAQKVHGERDSTRALIKVLLLGRHSRPLPGSPPGADPSCVREPGQACPGHGPRRSLCPRPRHVAPAPTGLCPGRIPRPARSDPPGDPTGPAAAACTHGRHHRRPPAACRKPDQAEAHQESMTYRPVKHSLHQLTSPLVNIHDPQDHQMPPKPADKRCCWS